MLRSFLLILTLISTSAYANTPEKLLEAIQYGDQKTAIALIEQGVPAHATTHDGITALMLAAGKGYPELTYKIIQQRTPLDAVDQYGRTALAHAALNGKAQTAALLLDYGANPNTIPQNQLASLRAFLAKRNAQKMQQTPQQLQQAQQLQQKPHIPHAPQELQPTALAPIEKTREKTTQQKQEKAPQKNKENTPINPLFAAITNQDTSTLQKLLEQGYQANITDQQGHSALMLATQQGLKPHVTLLLQYGANPNISNFLGHTALSYASEQGRADIAELLLKYGASPAALSPERYQALQQAIHAHNYQKNILQMQRKAELNKWH